MVRMKSFSHNNTVKSKGSRASVIYSPKGITNHNFDHEKRLISFLPNWQMKDDRIIFDSIKPKFTEVEDINGKWIITCDDKNIEVLPQINKLIENKSKLCGKLFCLAFNRILKIFSSSEGSFSIVEFGNKQVKAISALHVINEYSPKIYDVYLYLTFEYNKNLFEEFSTIKYKNMSYVLKILEKGKFFKVCISKDFFQSRKNFILHMYEHKLGKIFLDPEYNLHPMPSLDSVLLDLDHELLEYLKENKLSPLKIAKNETLPSIAYLVAFHTDDYFLRSENDLSDTKEEYKFTELPNVDLEMGLFVNKGKSIGECRIENSNKYIITYLATTALGSSGGALLNSEGEIIGINFGNYCDEEKKGEENGKNEQKFDIINKEENLQNYELQKNVNLGLNIKHPFFDFYVNGKEIDIDSLLEEFGEGIGKNDEFKIILEKQPDSNLKLLNKKRTFSMNDDPNNYLSKSHENKKRRNDDM